MLLSVPYVEGIAPFLEPYKEHIYDVFYSDDVLLSARHKGIDQLQLKRDLKKIKEMGINRTYLLNSIFINPSTDKILWNNQQSKVAEHLKTISNNFEIVTITNLMTLHDERIMDAVKDKILKCSVNNHINDRYMLKEMFDAADWDVINIGRGPNRNNRLINNMCDDIRNKYNAKSVILLNEGCHYHCMFKTFCDLSIADRNQNTGFDCVEHYNRGRPESFLKTACLFHDNVKHINADVFKLSGRGNHPEIIEKRIRHYLYGENIKINELLDIASIKPEITGDLDYGTIKKLGLVDNYNNCRNNCLECNDCDIVREYI